MKPEDVSHVLALEGFLDKHDALLKESKAEYKHYCGTAVEDLPFQRDLVNRALSASRTWTAEIATGLGKSVIAARIAVGRVAEGPVIYVCPNRTAVGDQHAGIMNKFVRTFETFGRRGMFGRVNELSRANDVSFLTPYALAYQLRHDRRRTLNALRSASCFVIDEAHHFPEDRENELRVYGDIYDAAEREVRNGLSVAMTGTWERLDGKLVMGRAMPDAVVSVQDAVDLGRCPEIYGVQVITDVVAKRAQARGDLYDLHLSAKERNRYLRGVADSILTVRRRYPVPFAAFARTHKDAYAIADAFNRQLSRAEKPMAVLLSDTPVPQRMETVAAIQRGELAGYVTCAVGEEALDLPALEVVHLVRRTRSYARNMQAIGRALRVFDGKRRALVVDYQTMLEGVQDRFIGLSLEDVAKRQGSRTETFVNGGPLIVQRTAVLAGMSMGEERALCLRTETSTSMAKQQLLDLAAAGGARPRAANRRNNRTVPREEALLARKLYNYVTEGRGTAYDPAFVEKLRELRPEWLEARHKADQNKSELLALAKRGGPKPKRQPSNKTSEHWLAIALYNYTHATSKAFNPSFTAELKRLRPDWFERKRDDGTERKKQLLEIARKNLPRPHWTSVLGKALARYIGTSSPLRDPVFHERLQTMRPDWFDCTWPRKMQLLKRAQAGRPRPSGSSDSKDEKRLAAVLWVYTHAQSKCYDALFTQKLRDVRPDWLEKQPSKWNRTGKQLGFGHKAA